MDTKKAELEKKAIGEIINDIEIGEAVYCKVLGKDIVISCVEIDDGDVKRCRVRRHNKP